MITQNNGTSLSQESTDSDVEIIGDSVTEAVPAPHTLRTPDPIPSKRPECKRVASSIRVALDSVTKDEGKSHGLLKFFSKGTKEDTKAYWAREEETAAATQSNSEAFNSHVVDVEKKQHERDLARNRQRKHRQKLKDEDIQNELRSPGGTKRKVTVPQLTLFIFDI